MFEIGDKVIYQGADKNAYRRYGIVKSIEDVNGKPQLTVEFDDGETFTAPVDDWSREFTNAYRNAVRAIQLPESVLKSADSWSNACTSTNSVVRNAKEWLWKGRKVYLYNRGGTAWQILSVVDDSKVIGGDYMSKDAAERAAKEYGLVVVDQPATSRLRFNSRACNSKNPVVRNAMAANVVARNSVEVEVSLMYAGRVQHAMRDAARTVSGVRITGTNTLYCPNDDAADEVVDILEQAGVPKREISLNSKRVARNANDWIDDPKKKRAMDEIDKKADALYRQLKDIARKFDALKNEQVKVGFYFADYSDAARQIREIHGME